MHMDYEYNGLTNSILKQDELLVTWNQIFTSPDTTVGLFYYYTIIG